MIEINNLTTVSVDEDFLKNIVKAVLKGEGIRTDPELSIALVEEGIMRKLNKKYRNKNRPTDILSFPELKTGITKIDSKNLGEIIICLKEVKKNSQNYKTNFEVEFSKVLIHGVLHLLGYNHGGSAKESERMEKKQNFYLAKILKV